MNDLISRSALLAWGGARTIKEAVGNWDELDNKAKAAVLRYAQRLKGVILDAPAVDAVEVVRCKDCKHYKPQKKSVYWENSALSCNRSVTMKMPPDGFCSCGERINKE